MHIISATIVCSLIFFAGCSSDDEPGDGADPGPDADLADPVADAGFGPEECPSELDVCDDRCTDVTRDSDHCGGCGQACTAAGRCEDSACECPTAFVPAQPSVIADQMLDAAPGYVSGAVAVVGGDFRNHSVVVTAGNSASLGQPLQINADVFVAIAYDVALSLKAKSTYFADAGSVTLTRRCAGGIAGTINDVTLAEIDPATLAPVPGACTTTIDSLSFDIGQACP